MINIEARVESMPLPAGLIQTAARAVLEEQSVAGDLSVVLTDDTQLRELNREYLGIDAVTDVLSFPSAEADPETGVTYLGDVIIAVPQAGVQAHAAGHTLEAEVQLLVVHGVLHLLGHDHAKPDAKERMWDVQHRVLARLGLQDIVIRE